MRLSFDADHLRRLLELSRAGARRVPMNRPGFTGEFLVQ